VAGHIGLLSGGGGGPDEKKCRGCVKCDGRKATNVTTDNTVRAEKIAIIVIRGVCFMRDKVPRGL